MAKKQKKATSERVPTKHQLSKWQRQMKIRRIVIIAAVVFLVGIAGWVGYEYYADYKASVAPWREVVIEVNDVPFTMEYFVKILDAYTQGMNSTVVSSMANYIANMAADDITKDELIRQGAKNLGIEVTAEEIDAGLEKYGLPDNEAYRNIISAVLLQGKLNEEYFGPRLPDTMEQAHVQVMLVESQEVATELIAEVEAGGNFTALVGEFSCNSSIEGDLGWLPTELMPNTLIADAAFNLTPGEISQPIYDETAIKDVGYWLIEVTDKQGDKIKARAMLLGSEAEAERVKAELVSGNFSSLAGNYSQHKSKTEGGELGLLKRGDMGSNSFDQVAFNITLNEVSEPVKDESVHTTGGYWLVKVVDRGDHELEEAVRKELIDKHFNAWFEEWKGNSTIENRLDASKILWAVNKVLEGR
ncbi:MAG: peptidylprolyl isomerase [Dehalococcoidia bacterium]|nr:peptidylprolyl isomerase [Dehalococcoidia bacterium]